MHHQFFFKTILTLWVKNTIYDIFQQRHIQTAVSWQRVTPLKNPFDKKYVTKTVKHDIFLAKYAILRTV